MPFDETKSHSLNEVNLFFAKTYNGLCWSYLEKDQRSTDDTAKMINLAHASLQHWSECKECTPVNLLRGEYLIAMAYSLAGRGEPAYHHAQRCLDLAFSEPGAMMDFDIAHTYMVMARVSALTGLEKEAKEYLSKMVEAASVIKNNADKQFVVADLRIGSWYNQTGLVQEIIESLGYPLSPSA